MGFASHSFDAAIRAKGHISWFAAAMVISDQNRSGDTLTSDDTVNEGMGFGLGVQVESMTQLKHIDIGANAFARHVHQMVVVGEKDHLRAA